MSIIVELIEATGLSGREITRLIATAPARYRVFPIAKRDGSERMIAQPSRELKALQHFIMSEKLSKLPVHKAAAAYIGGKNIYENAAAHLNSSVLMKLDFRAFFPSIKVRDWVNYVRKSDNSVMEISDLYSYAQILFWGEIKNSTKPQCLSIGAPTSPMLSNILMYNFDVAVSAIAEYTRVNYTRYADDITISGECVDDLIKAETKIRSYVKRMKSPSLQFNDEKRGIFSTAQRRMVTGLVLTPDNKISIGRARKREISTMIHKLSLDLLDKYDKAKLKGLLGFTVANEAAFVNRLREKYGGDIIDQAMKYHIPSRASTYAIDPLPEID